MFLVHCKLAASFHSNDRNGRDWIIFGDETFKRGKAGHVDVDGGFVAWTIHHMFFGLVLANIRLPPKEITC